MEIKEYIPQISEMLYVGLCDTIGTPGQIKIRRDVDDIKEMIFNSVPRSSRIMESGSKREGFRLPTSDLDVMIWNSDCTVICDLSHLPPSKILILMEFHDTPPGFANLKPLTHIIEIGPPSIVSVNDQLYISSSLFKERTQRQLQSIPLFRSTTFHGPCTSGVLITLEFDVACCFSCKQWPPPAYHWIERCQTRKWPSSHVRQDIINNGCHLVAVGSEKSTSPQEYETEWRISFSQAEYKLVCSMNHAQFLCYGLLKIFLKEVLNVGLEDPVLCSYFIKTTLFWKIQENTLSVWCSNNILLCVWVCFKYLIQCVYRGELPNFFIPQNNMFIKKIHGTTQKQLFRRLMTLYNMGFSCLLLSPSLYQILSTAILNPHLQVSTKENNIISEVELDFELVDQICGCYALITAEDFNGTFACVMSEYNQCKTIPVSQNHIAVLHVIRSIFLVRHAFCLDKSLEDTNMHTTNQCRPLDMLISATESGFISDTVYVVMYLYNKKRYIEALYYIERTKQQLRQSHVLDICSGVVNKERYLEAVRGKSLIDRFTKAVSCDIIIDEILCIDELRLEVCVMKRKGVGFLHVPPMVMTHMLSFLCHHHLGDRLRSRQSLCDLQTMLHYDEGKYLLFGYGNISWQILGICEQNYGDKEKALYSYQQSYTSDPKFQTYQMKTATWTRIQNIISK